MLSDFPVIVQFIDELMNNEWHSNILKRIFYFQRRTNSCSKVPTLGIISKLVPI